MIKKIICLGVIVIMVFSLAACGSSKYNAVALNDGIVTRTEFLQETTEPQKLILRNQNEIDKVFEEFPCIDFESQMVVVYVYWNTLLGQQKIKSIKVDDQTLKIEFKVENHLSSGQKTGLPPSRRFLIVKLDKLDVVEVEFSIVR